jgi:uridine kinase
MTPYFIGLAGGTGTGKTTIAFALQDKYPSHISVVHLDDYHKKRLEAPLLYNMTNWDHPKAVDFEKLIYDLQELKQGRAITVMTKDERFNPKYNGKEFGQLPMEIIPKPIIIVEGYLVLWHPEVRAFFSFSVYLNLSFRLMMRRRSKAKENKKDYLEKVVRPMHGKYVEGTKQYADCVIEMGNLSQDQAVEKVEMALKTAAGGII